MPNAYPALQGERLISPLPSSPSIFLLRSVPVGEIIVGASAAPDADTTHATSGEQQSGERREDGHTPFRDFSKAPSYTFPSFLAANHINLLRILRKTAKKIMRILLRRCLSNSYEMENASSGRSPREMLLLFVIADISGKSATAMRILPRFKGGMSIKDL